MKRKYPYFFLLLVGGCSLGCLRAQETLPNFKIKDLGKAGVQIDWLNPHKDCQQLSVQSATDTLHFKTILHAKNPNRYDNGFIDKRVAARPVYYRILYVLKGGKFYFSTTKSLGNSTNPVVSTSNAQTWKASKFVYCMGRGNPTIYLPEAQKHLYQLVFKEESGRTVFEIKGLRETETYLDKANFVHTGWFLFDLYEDGIIKEQGSILIQKD